MKYILIPTTNYYYRGLFLSRVRLHELNRVENRLNEENEVKENNRVLVRVCVCEGVRKKTKFDDSYSRIRSYSRKG